MAKKVLKCIFCGGLMRWDSDLDLYECKECQTTITPGRLAFELEKQLEKKTTDDGLFSPEVAKILSIPRRTNRKEPINRGPVGSLAPGGNKTGKRKKNLKGNKVYMDPWIAI